MFKHRTKMFSFQGIDLYIDMSWLLLAFLIVWTLGQGYFPNASVGLSLGVYWLMALVGAFGLFASIVLHEFGHALVAQRQGIPTKGITLFVFGGVAEMEDEPPTPKAELWMALGGPVVTLTLMLLFGGMTLLGRALEWHSAILAVGWYLAGINLLLLAFNLVPALPLDGGRILRAALWNWRGSLQWSSQVTSRIGAGFAWLLILLGLGFFFSGQLIAGVWWFLLGLFLRTTSAQSYQLVLIRQALQGEKVARFLQPEPISVGTSLSIRELVDEYIYKFHMRKLPVVEQGELVGCISLAQIKHLPSYEWSDRNVGGAMKSCAPASLITPEEDAFQALKKMDQQQVDHLFVVQEHRLLGTLHFQDLIQFLSLKLELEDDEVFSVPAHYQGVYAHQ